MLLIPFVSFYFFKGNVSSIPFISFAQCDFRRKTPMASSSCKSCLVLKVFSRRTNHSSQSLHFPHGLIFNLPSRRFLYWTGIWNKLFCCHHSITSSAVQGAGLFLCLLSLDRCLSVWACNEITPAQKVVKERVCISFDIDSATIRT